VAPVAQLAIEEAEPPAEVEEQQPEPPKPAPARKAKGKPPVPAWEDVLLGVRSGGQR